MPKFAGDVLPVSGLFAVAKPSGMTSMAVVERIQSLMSDSPLFVDAETLDKNRATKRKPKRKGGGLVKVGQGGTLDPLADGVLGEVPKIVASARRR